MSVRAGYEIEDIQRVVHAVIAAKITGGAPWSSWTAILGWPESDVLNNLSKPVIYVEPPTMIARTVQQGAMSSGVWEMIVGCWDDRKTGGTQEINIIGSQLLNFFRDKKTSHDTTKITITLGSTTYTSKDLIDMGVNVISIVGPREIATTDLKEFRTEFILTIRN